MPDPSGRARGGENADSRDSVEFPRVRRHQRLADRDASRCGLSHERDARRPASGTAARDRVARSGRRVPAARPVGATRTARRPRAFRSSWMHLPEIGGAVRAAAEEVGLPVHEAQHFEYVRPIRLGESYDLMLEFRREQEPARLIVTADVFDLEGALRRPHRLDAAPDRPRRNSRTAPSRRRPLMSGPNAAPRVGEKLPPRTIGPFSRRRSRRLCRRFRQFQSAASRPRFCARVRFFGAARPRDAAARRFRADVARLARRSGGDRADAASF